MTAAPTADPRPADDRPSWGCLVRAFGRVGLQSFGGPAAQIAVLHREVVEERRWIDEPRYLHALQFCMLLPGPEAMQLATYCGWLVRGTAGGLVAGLLFVLPGAAALLAISAAYALWRHVPAVDAAFFGIKAAVLAIVAQAVVRVGRRALRTRGAVALAVAAFAALLVFGVPFPWVVAAAAVTGWTASRVRPGAFAADAAADRIPVPRPSVRRTLATAAAWLALWLVPVAALVAAAPAGPFAEMATFFSGAATVTFGGAYAVLAYVQQHAVGTRGWLTAGEMMDGLGLAESTPGPLVLVLQFVAFLAAWKQPGELPPLAAGAAGAAVMLWTTFVPCFLWIFAFAPWVEFLRGVRALSTALAAITAAVVGVIAHLGAVLTLHTLFATVSETGAGPVRAPVPDLATFDPAAAAVAAGAAVLLFRFRAGLGWTLAAAAAAGLLLR